MPARTAAVSTRVALLPCYEAMRDFVCLPFPPRLFLSAPCQAGSTVPPDDGVF